MIDVYRESLVSPVGHGGSTATGPTEYCPLGFRSSPREPGKDKRASDCLGKTHHFQIISCSVVKCDSQSCSTATTI